MNTSLLSKTLSSLTLGVMVLSASPAAALGITSATSADGVLRAKVSHVSVDTSTNVGSHLSVKRSGSDAKTSQNANVSVTRCTRTTGEDRGRCEKILSGDGKVDTKTTVAAEAKRSNENAIVTAKARIEKMLSRAFRLVAYTAKRMCSSQNDSTTSIRDCMADIKSHVQARVSTMIEVAFAI